MGLSMGLCGCSHSMAAGFPQSKGSKRSSEKLQFLLLPNLKPASLFPPPSIGHTKSALIKRGRRLHKSLNIRRCGSLGILLETQYHKLRQINIKCERLYPLTYSDISLDYWHQLIHCHPSSHPILLPLGALYWLLFPCLLKSTLISDLTTNINVHL